MVKVLDVYFGWIILIDVVILGGNKIIFLLIDKIIKVWNFDNIFEDVYLIDCLEKLIEFIYVFDESFYGVMMSRNCVGVWDLNMGKLVYIFEICVVVILVRIIKDGKNVVVVEIGKFFYWEVE